MPIEPLRGDIRADPALDHQLRAVLARLSEGAELPRELPGIAALARRLVEGAPVAELDRLIRDLSHAGYVRGALVSVAAHLRLRPRPDLVLVLARELCDALAPDLGVELARAALALPEVEDTRWQPTGPYAAANLLLGDTLLDRGDPLGALRHFEALLAVDIDHARALRGWSTAQRRLGRGGAHASRGLALLEGLDATELVAGLGVDRYELGRPLGRGRHAVVYQAFDRRVGRDVAIKRLVAEGSDGRLVSARFFAEARTLARVRSPHVIALLDVQPAHRFVALSLCRGGNLRVAVRKRLLGPADLPRVGVQIVSALRAVHAAGAVHRDIKPANILVREAREGSAVALADFGLALADTRSGSGHAGTLRYLAPELRSPGPAARATPASDLFSAGVVLLELALHPQPLPAVFDQIGAAAFDPEEHVPKDLPSGWTDRLVRMLGPDPAARG
ncbi:serine/threonine-protein kinase [Nannocystis punicea]|uniref:Serine/threonine-protein kinase n=1 Tax=Nannocystis punicea TaxID=2995304 RepID=A0ABY7GSE0_9BACT|nr:serine/threonine-protein kinase [Nannocystis poenicansa]WAS89851.1 serine/threonine-protein kinase [Nannocystis poenicansa]